MREIKFRVWWKPLFLNDDNKWEMKYLDIMEFTYDNTLYFTDIKSHYIDESPGHTEYKIMQYAGLKDKNGKEIYEGDIIKKGECIYKVVFGSGAFLFQGISHRNSGYFTHTQSSEFEILGNIYENPELCK